MSLVPNCVFKAFEIHLPSLVQKLSPSCSNDTSSFAIASERNVMYSSISDPLTLPSASNSMSYTFWPVALSTICALLSRDSSMPRDLRIVRSSLIMTFCWSSLSTFLSSFLKILCKSSCELTLIAPVLEAVSALMMILPSCSIKPSAFRSDGLYPAASISSLLLKAITSEPAFLANLPAFSASLRIISRRAA